jgi:hypothetical protein
MNAKNFDLLIQTYEHYYKQVFSDNSYRVNASENEKLIENFFKLLDKNGYVENSIGINFLNAFFAFQIEYWQTKEIQRKPTLSWFIGKKAIERYFSVEDRELKNYWVNLNTQGINLYEQKQEGNNYEDQLRKTYHNKDNGLLFCLENTSLYTTSATCLTCKFKEDCKKLLKQNYPLLWRKRLN